MKTKNIRNIQAKRKVYRYSVGENQLRDELLRLRKDDADSIKKTRPLSPAQQNAYEYTFGENKLRSEMLTLREQHLAEIAKKQFKFAGTLTTVGTAAEEDFEIIGVKTGMHCLVGIKAVGAAPVTIVNQICGQDKITVTFSADPDDDHVITYMVCQ